MPLYWIWFAQLNNLTFRQKHQILQVIPDPEELYNASRQVLSRYFEDSIVRALLDKELAGARRILKDCTDRRIQILNCREEAFPQRLLNIEEAPVILYYQGSLPDWNDRPVIGVVGTRKSSPYGERTTRAVAAQIAACGGLVISGGADGIDAAALEAASRMEKPTVTVFAGGVDVIYPKKNTALFRKLLEKGCILSECPPGTATLDWRFLRRNRLISGISNGVVVAEAPERSGALNTADHALSQGRDVFVIPGNLGVATCAGSNRLLQQGAFPVLCGWDAVKQYENLYPGKVENVPVPLPEAVYEEEQKVAQREEIPKTIRAKEKEVAKKSIDNREECPYSVLNKTKTQLTEEEKSVYALLTEEPQFPDAVLGQSELPAGTVQSILTKLTLKGLVKHCSGGQIARK